MSYKDVYLNYYPHKDACPQDTQPCLGGDCKYWLKDGKCQYVEMTYLLNDFLGQDTGTIFLFYHKKDGGFSEVNFHISQSITDKENFAIPPKVQLSIGFNSSRLAERVREQFGLSDWKIRHVNFEGGDDANLEKFLDFTWDKREEVLRFVKDMHEMMLRVIEFEVVVNTCQLCKEKALELVDHVNWSICRDCEKKIVSENIGDYFCP